MINLLDYVLALNHLYGLAFKDKVVEIYNKQDDEQEIDENAVNEILGNCVN